MSSTLTVFGFGAFDPLPDVSPFVHKLEDHLRLAGVAYDKRPGNIRTAPRGKLPFIEHEGQRIPDSEGAIEHLRSRGIADLDAELSAAAKAEAFALRAMIERDLYFALAYFRWQADAGWLGGYRAAIGAVVQGSGAPGFLLPVILPMIRRATLSQLHAQGTGRMGADEVAAHGRQIFETLEQFARARSGPLWFGERPSSFDAVFHAFAAAVIEPALPSPLRGALLEQETLMRRYEALSKRLAATAAAG